MKKKFVVKAWAATGSHGGIFVFEGGSVGRSYPHLMEIYSQRIDQYLIPVTITYEKDV